MGDFSHAAALKDVPGGCLIVSIMEALVGHDDAELGLWAAQGLDRPRSDESRTAVPSMVEIEEERWCSPFAPKAHP